MTRSILLILLILSPLSSRGSGEVPGALSTSSFVYLELGTWSNILFGTIERCKATQTGPNQYGVPPPEIVETWTIDQGLVSTIRTNYWLISGSASPTRTTQVEQAYCWCDLYPDFCVGGEDDFWDFCWTTKTARAYNETSIGTNWTVAQTNISVTNWTPTAEQLEIIGENKVSQQLTRAFVVALDETIIRLPPYFIRHTAVSGSVMDTWFETVRSTNWGWICDEGGSNCHWEVQPWFIYSNVPPLWTFAEIMTNYGIGMVRQEAVLATNDSTLAVSGWQVGNYTALSVTVTYRASSIVYRTAAFTRSPERSMTTTTLWKAMAIPAVPVAISTTACEDASFEVPEFTCRWTEVFSDQYAVDPSGMTNLTSRPIIKFAVGMPQVLDYSGCQVDTQSISALQYDDENPWTIGVSGFYWNTNTLSATRTSEIFTVTKQVTSTVLVCSNPFYRITAVAVTSLSSSVYMQPGDSITVLFTNVMATYGTASWYTYPEDINERLRVLSECRWTWKPTVWSNLAYEVYVGWTQDAATVCSVVLHRDDYYAYSVSRPAAWGWQGEYYFSHLAIEGKSTAKPASPFLCPDLVASVDWYAGFQPWAWPTIDGYSSCSDVSSAPVGYPLGGANWPKAVMSGSKPLGSVYWEGDSLGGPIPQRSCGRCDGGTGHVATTARGWAVDDWTTDGQPGVLLKWNFDHVVSVP